MFLRRVDVTTPLPFPVPTWCASGRKWCAATRAPVAGWRSAVAASPTWWSASAATIGPPVSSHCYVGETPPRCRRKAAAVSAKRGCDVGKVGGEVFVWRCSQRSAWVGEVSDLVNLTKGLFLFSHRLLSAIALHRQSIKRNRFQMLYRSSLGRESLTSAYVRAFMCVCKWNEASISSICIYSFITLYGYIKYLLLHIYFICNNFRNGINSTLSNSWHGNPI